MSTVKGAEIPGGPRGVRLRASVTGAPGVRGEPDAKLVQAMALPSFLRLAGKREIRPGGKHGWEWVMKLLASVAGERVLLVSTHWKRGRLPEGLSESGVSVVTLDALPLGVMDAGAFDAVIIEDELAYLNDDSRVAVIGEARRVLRDGGRVVLHELHWRQSPSGALLAAMPEVWGRVPSPMTMDGWWRLLEQAGLSPVKWHIGALGWLRERQVVLDEGRERAAEFLARANGEGPVSQRLALSIAHAVEYARFYGWVVMVGRARGGPEQSRPRCNPAREL